MLVGDAPFLRRRRSSSSYPRRVRNSSSSLPPPLRASPSPGPASNALLELDLGFFRLYARILRPLSAGLPTDRRGSRRPGGISAGRTSARQRIPEPARRRRAAGMLH